MRRFIGLALLSLALAAAHPAAAQKPKSPDTPMILTWSPELQSRGYRTMEDLFEVLVIKRGRKVHPLPAAARTIDVAYPYEGKTWTAADYMAAFDVSGVLVLKDGKVLMERYAMGRKPEDRWTSFSVAKSVTSTLVGAAIADGKIKGLNAVVTDYIPELKGSGYDGVTVRQLLMMSSGVKWNEDYTDPKSDVASAGGAIEDPKVNPIVSYMRKLPRENAPGSTFNYNTGETDLVGVLVSNAVGKSLSKYASEKIWKPYGMERDGIWVTDLAGHERGGCCMSMTLRDYGRVGQFILDGGKAGGKQILPPGWTTEATSKQIENGVGGYGYFWWIRPQGGFEARGIFGQGIVIVPEDKLVIVVNSAWPRATGRDLSAARTAFYEAIRAAAKAN
ncbi:MAG: serine hydrolase [Phenylobacterium sp.]|uniref:serine hydrolase domain-containing protein n=1 Tax=Phenylobacterium sp. TaxID=1871053 RepID=UPI001A4F4E05|nr:serine hydrolase [Phenylobacterium sp.]MBL8554314.1 serine hydrolase [Phenylobacterium sp.]